MSRSLPLRIYHPRKDEPDERVFSFESDLQVDGPLVSCVMVSRGDRFPAALAIDCYRRQTYARRELVIVSARPESEVEKLVGEIGDPSIRYVSAAPASLGELRNISVAHSRGDLVCQWDDDDLSAPDRILLMTAALGVSKSRACYLRRVNLWWPEQRRLVISGFRMWENTMLVRREALPVYSALNLEEDTQIALMIGDHHRVCLMDAPDCYAYIFHGGNAWHADHFDRLFDVATEQIAGRDYDDRIANPASALPFSAYLAASAERWS